MGKVSLIKERRTSWVFFFNTVTSSESGKGNPSSLVKVIPVPFGRTFQGKS